MTSSVITEQLKQLPTRPGVYLMRDAEGNVLYVGKAASLASRVRSYFTSGQKLPPKTELLVATAHELEFFITNSEQEALILELNLVKRYRPPFNVRLKDDKAFPYLMIDLNEEWPRLQITRRMDAPGARYFGPFANAWSVRQTLKVIKGIFPLRSCSKELTGTDPRPCLDYHIHHCLAPCVGAVSKREYARVIKQVILFLQGKEERVARELKARMARAAETLDFERAALLRDQIQAIERVIEGQKIAATVRGEQDVIAFAQDGDQACVQVFFVRGSKIIGRESFVLQGTRGEPPERIMTGFVQQFYHSAPNVPPLVLLQHPVEDEDVIRMWLQGKRGGAVRLDVPRRGGKRQMVELVAENARQALQHLRIKQLAAPATLSAALEGVRGALRLPGPPARMEAYDISNIQGTAAVGSMVVFEKGHPKPAHYRRFRIKTVPGADDYAMLREVLRRRFGRARDQAGDTWAVRPDLVLIDGGRGQLNAAVAVMEEMGVASVPVASLAKENEEIYTPGAKEPVLLPASSPALQLLQRLRDEAHRFALGYHLKVRRRAAFASPLDAVPGIGPRRKKSLLRRFGSVRAIREALVEDLAAAAGISLGLATRVKELL